MICHWPAERSVKGKTVTEVLKMLQAKPSFSLYGPTLAVKWLSSGPVCLRNFAIECYSQRP